MSEDIEESNIETKDMSVKMPIDEYVKLKAAYDLNLSKHEIEKKAHQEGVTDGLRMLMDSTGDKNALRHALRSFGGLSDEEIGKLIPSFQKMISMGAGRQ